ncbi:hypothetical protein TNCV_3957591 [Trichonephila clavipes]|nr:hypothetical protein TNCV_3957591 [Trichonephila clavipes]
MSYSGATRAGRLKVWANCARAQGLAFDGGLSFRLTLRKIMVRIILLVQYYSRTYFRRAVGSLVVRASDSRPEGLGSMLNVTKYPPSAHGVRAR